jgi:hypothetical protein
MTPEEASRIGRMPHPPAGYQTQSPDTSPEVERILFEGYRRMTAPEKARRITELCAACEQLARAGIRERHPDATEREIRLRLASLRLDRETMIRVFDWDPERMGY